MACLILCRRNKIYRVKTGQRSRLTRLVLKPMPSCPILGSCFWQRPLLHPDDTQKLASAGLRGRGLPPHPHVHTITPSNTPWGWPLLAPAWHSHPHCHQAGPPGTRGTRQVSAHVTCRNCLHSNPLNSLSGGETEAQSNSPESPSILSPDLQPHWAGCRALPPDLRLLKALSLYSSFQPTPLP